VTNKSCLKLLFKNHAEKKCLASVGGRKQKTEEEKKLVRPGVIFAFSQQFAVVLRLAGCLPHFGQLFWPVQ